MKNRIFYFWALLLLVIALHIPTGLFAAPAPSKPSPVSQKETLNQLRGTLRTKLSSYRNDPPSGSTLPSAPSTNSVNHGEQYIKSPYQYKPGEVVPPQGAEDGWSSPGWSTPTGRLPSGGPASCTDADIANMSTANLVAYLTMNSSDCLYYLQYYSSNLRSVLTDAHLTAVFQAIQQNARTYNGTNSSHLKELMLFANMAYYHTFPQSISFAGVKPAAVAALNEFGSNSHRNDFNADASTILFHWSAIATSLSGHFINDTKAVLVNVLSTFNNNQARWADDTQKRIVNQMLMNLWIHIGQNAMVDGSGRAGNSDYQEAIDAINADLINVLRDLALNTRLWASTLKYDIVKSAVFTLGGIGKISTHASSVEDKLLSVTTTHQPFSRPYLFVYEALDRYMRCPNSKFTMVCKADLLSMAEAEAFPNRYEFDDGAFVILTPAAVDTAQSLYHAAKQTDAQFGRITETIRPIPADPNPRLTVRLYANQWEYEDFQEFLYGLDVGNSGIYYEQKGTFYTYVESATTGTTGLQDKFRHEYSHYLVGRFLINGLWGEHLPFHNAKIWFEEGFAEFLSWSTPADGVKVRKKLVEWIQADGTRRMTVSQILHANYDQNAFKFYRYSGLFMNYLYLNDRVKFKHLLYLLRYELTDDFNALIESWSTDAGLEAAYQAFLNQQVANVGTLTNPSTTFPNLATLSTNDPLQIEAQFPNVADAFLEQCSVAATSMNSRFSCQGTLIGASNTNIADPFGIEAATWPDFNAKLDTIIRQSTAGTLNNFQGMNCRMGAIYLLPDPVNNVGSAFVPQANFYCDGPLAPNSLRLADRATQITEDINSLGDYMANCRDDGDRVSCDLSLRNAPPLVLSAWEQKVLFFERLYAIRPSYYHTLTGDSESETSEFTCNVSLEFE